MKECSILDDLHKIHSNPSTSNKIYISTKDETLEYEVFLIFKDSVNINTY